MLRVYACIWSNDKAAEMARFYKSIFKGTKIGKTSFWGSNPMGVKEGAVLTLHLTVLGQKIMLLDGHMKMPFNESISFVLPCRTQREIDTYWKKLTSGGGRPVECGWLVDKYGVHWQVVPADFEKWTTSRNRKKKDAVMHAMWRMVKLDYGKLKEAYERA